MSHSPTSPADTPKVPGRWTATFVHPVPDALAAFLEGLGEGRLLGVRCKSCAKVSTAPRIRCLFCHARTGDDLVEVGPVGVIRSACVALVPMAGATGVPDAMACVQPSGADSALLARLRGVEALTGDDLTAQVGQRCRFRPPAEPVGTWADLEFELLGR